MNKTMKTTEEVVMSTDCVILFIIHGVVICRAFGNKSSLQLSKISFIFNSVAARSIIVF